MLRPRWKLTLVERPSVSSRSARVFREGLGLLETPKQAKTQAMGQLRKNQFKPRGAELVKASVRPQFQPAGA